MKLLNERVSQLLADNLVSEQERWVLWLPVAFGTGIGAYFALLFEPPSWIGLVVVTMFGMAAYMCRRKPPLMLVVLIFSVILAGFAAAQIRTAIVSAPVLQSRYGPTTLSGRAISVETFSSGSRVTLDTARIGGLGPERTPDRVRVRISAREPLINVGDWIRLRAVLNPPPAPAAPGAFDFQRRSFFASLGAVGFAVGKPEVLAAAQASSVWSPALAVEKLRQAVSIRVRNAVPGSEGAVATALMTGDRGTIPEDVLAAMRDSGLAHLLAISGLHIGLVAGIIFFSVRGFLALLPAVALRQPIKKWAATVAVAGAFGYALLAGATVPTMRAFLMIALVLVAILLDRRGLSMRLVAWAALAVLILHPESLLGASFQMSFAAVVALIAAYESASPRFAIMRRGAGLGRRLLLYLAGVSLTTLVAGMATAPFAAFNFNRMADYGLAANLIAVPVTALWIMPAGVASFLLMPFGWEGVALVPMGWGIGVVLGAARTVASWPGAVTLIPVMPVWGIVVVALGGLWLCLWQRRWRFWGLPVMALGVISVLADRVPDILIDGDGQLMATRSDSGLLNVSTARSGTFDRETWMRLAGQAGKPATWPTNGGNGRLSCDIGGCLFRAEGVTVALVRHPSALAEDCWVADVVIATMPVRGACTEPAVVIDRFDLWRNGAHAVWLEDGYARIESVNVNRGRRPWVVRPEARQSD